MKHFIFLFAVVLFNTTLSAYEITVSPKYTINPKGSKASFWKAYRVKGFDASIKGTRYTFSRIQKSYGSWEVSIDSDPIGKIRFYEKSDLTYSWMFDLKGVTFSVSFIDKNDPRQLKLKVGGTTYYMSNQEPDCNSIFDLYESKENIDSYDFDKHLINGSAITACDKTDWTFTVKNNDLENNVIIAHIFTSVMAMTVRGM